MRSVIDLPLRAARIAPLVAARRSHSGPTWGSELWGLRTEMFMWLLRPSVSDADVGCEVIARGKGTVARATTREAELRQQLVADAKGRFKDKYACELVGRECARRFLSCCDGENRRIVLELGRAQLRYNQPVQLQLIAEGAVRGGLRVSRVCARADCICRLGDEYLTQCKVEAKLKKQLANQAVHRVKALYEASGLGKFEPPMEAYVGTATMGDSSGVREAQGASGYAGRGHAAQSPRKLQRTIIAPREDLAAQSASAAAVPTQKAAAFPDFVALVHGVQPGLAQLRDDVVHTASPAALSACDTPQP